MTISKRDLPRPKRLTDEERAADRAVVRGECEVHYSRENLEYLNRATSLYRISAPSEHLNTLWDLLPSRRTGRGDHDGRCYIEFRAAGDAAAAEVARTIDLPDVQLHTGLGVHRQEVQL